MKIIKLWGEKLDDRQLFEITRDLKEGATLIAPTDTLYAITCDALSAKAVEKVCRLKGIKSEKTNLSIICSDISMAAEYGKFDNATYRMLKELTPGPYTFLCRASHSLPSIFKRRKVVGVRIPDCEVVRQIASELGNPLLTTSIQYEDSDYARNPELIAEAYYDKVDMIVEGPEGGETPSTIIDCTGSEPEVIREGLGPVEF